MNLQKSLTLSLALVTLLGLAAAGASAQTISKGSFTLPEDAYWENSLLPAGQYSIVFDRNTGGSGLISLRGEGVAVRFLAPAGYLVTSSRGRLKLEEVSGTYYVREFDDSVFGRAFRFSLPKAARQVATSAGVRQTVTVPVSAE